MSVEQVSHDRLSEWSLLLLVVFTDSTNVHQAPTVCQVLSRHKNQISEQDTPRPIASWGLHSGRGERQ